MSKLNPKNGFAVLKPIEEQEQTYGNIVIPDLGKERPEMGEVIAVSQTYNWHRGEYVDSQFQVGHRAVPKGSLLACPEVDAIHRDIPLFARSFRSVDTRHRALGILEAKPPTSGR